LRTAWNPAEMDGLLLLVPKATATGHVGAGDFDMDRDGRLRRGRDYVYTGAQIIATKGLATIPEPVFSLNRFWDRMLADGRLYGCIHDGGWCDVGRPASITLAEALLGEAQDV
ncbi:MAG: nucleotidyltransferase family protein, partial [Albidovulum sp.]